MKKHNKISNTESPAFSFKNTWMKILRWSFYAALAWLAAYFATVVPVMDFWPNFTPIIVAASLFVANTIKEYIKKRK